MAALISGFTSSRTKTRTDFTKKNYLIISSCPPANSGSSSQDRAPAKKTQTWLNDNFVSFGDKDM